MDLNRKPAASVPTAARNIFPTTRRHHHRKPTSSDRFLRIPPHPHHLQPETTDETELTEHDIYCSSPDYSSSTSATSSFHPTPSPSPSSTSHISHHHGILAALPVENNSSEIHSVFNHKASSASVSSPSTSSLLSTPSSMSPSSRLRLPKRPPPPPKTLHLHHHHQSAPVNVPVLSEAMRRSRAERGLDDLIADSDEEVEDDTNTGMFLPPHEIIAAKDSSSILSCSVMEGAGRTLKGRDLRHVRNAVWQTTGFLD